MLSVEKDDYVVVSDPTAKKTKGRLVRVTRNKQGSCKGVVINTKMEEDAETQYVEFGLADVLSAHGPQPRFGISYGCKVEVYFGHSKTKFGTLHYWRGLKQEERVRIEKMMGKMYVRMKKDKILLGKDVDYTIRANSGTMIGHYKHSSKKDRHDELCLQRSEYTKKSLPLSELNYLFCHEYAHGIWFTRMSPETQGEWIKAYSRNVTLSKVKTERVDKMRSELIETGRVADYAKGLDEEDKAAFKECLKFIKRLHSISPRNINALLVDVSDLTDYWPKNGVMLQNKQIVVSEYALKSVEEYFSEAFAFWYADIKVLPKSVEKLMLRTMKELRASSNSSVNMDDDFSIDGDG